MTGPDISSSGSSSSESSDDSDHPGEGIYTVGKLGVSPYASKFPEVYRLLTAFRYF